MRDVSDTQRDGRAVSLAVCRDCCCGTLSKHPHFDHDAQLERLRAAITADHTVVVSDCLDACESSNVVVVRPSSSGRSKGGRAIWLGKIFNREHEKAIAEWVIAGGPGIADLPRALRHKKIQAPKNGKKK